MRNWIRLATLCFSLALVGGILVHDAVSAQMSLRMSSHDMTVDAGTDRNCPACPSDTTDAATCDLDCTTPVLVFTAAPDVTAVKMRNAHLVPVVDSGLRCFDPGVEPSPPRGTILI